MKRLLAVTATLALLCLGSVAQATISVDTVRVGDPGNVGQLSGEGGAGPRICGSVSYSFNIGKYEVTAGQYTAFLNAVAKTDTYGLYNTKMYEDSRGCKIERTGTAGDYSYSVASDWANRPVNYVSFWDACRFANWLCNGQKSGAQDATTTERGAYTLDGFNGAETEYNFIKRNEGWAWAVTSEDEWYKAAYYKGGGTNSGYWLYPTQSDNTPSNNLTNPDGGNNANFDQDGLTIGNPYYLTEVGEFELSESAYGTFDQGGNVWEWNESLFLNSAARGRRGGSFHTSHSHLASTYRNYGYQCLEEYDTGFRVAQAVPEPSSIVTWLGGLAGLIRLKRRKA